MSTPLMTFAVGLTRWWVQLYTRGVSPEQRNARRAEIESDLWEHGAGNGEDGVGPETTAFQVLSRLVLGVPADLSWRLEQTGARSSDESQKSFPKGRSRMLTITSRAFTGVAGLMMTFTVLIGFLVAFGGGENDIAGFELPRFLWGIVGVAVAAVILGGIWASSRSPLLGGVVVLIGTAPLAALTVWSVLAPILWILLALFVVLKVLAGARHDPRAAA